MNEAAPASEGSIFSPSERIDKILEARYDALTATTDPSYPPFLGFGSSDEVRSLLTSQGIDLKNLRVEVSESGRRIRVFAEEGTNPIYDNYFSNPERRDEEQRAVGAMYEGYDEEM